MIATAATEFDVKQVILFDGSFGPKETEKLTHAVGHDCTQFDALREAVGVLESKERNDELSPAGRVRLGVGLCLIGRFSEAVTTLKKGDGGALAHFYQARALFAMESYEESLKSYELAQKAGYCADACTLGKAEAYRYMEHHGKSLAELDKLSGAVEQTAEYLYQRGATIASLGVDTNEAVALYERAVIADRTHSGSLFGLALESERRGNDEEALELYKRAAANFPTNVGLLINLGILYEDLGQYEQAVLCFQRVLDAYPNNEKARLFLKDARASNEMPFDEETQRKQDRVGQLLNLPVTDFELSVRSRNCLKSMNILTLGDLCRHTEQELLGSKNFGETSLIEIREMLTLKGLRLGQYAPEKHAPETIEVESLSPDEQAVLLRPVTDLHLSVRARKCMTRLNIQTIAELVRKTADELLECKNFGVTSLKEIREKLTAYGIKLRGE